jgi:hypothetical protein
MCHNFFFKNINYKKAKLDGLKLYLLSFSFMNLPDFQDSREIENDYQSRKSLKKKNFLLKAG